MSLGELEAVGVDMLSLVLVGASTTRRVPRLHGASGCMRRGPFR
jgi:precorrin-3B methylase